MGRLNVLETKADEKKPVDAGRSPLVSPSPSRSSTAGPSTPRMARLYVPGTMAKKKKPVYAARSPLVAPAQCIHSPNHNIFGSITPSWCMPVKVVAPAQCTNSPIRNIFGSITPSWCLPVKEASAPTPTASTASSPVAAPPLPTKRTLRNLFDPPRTLVSAARKQAPSSSVAAPELVVEVSIDERKAGENKPLTAAPSPFTAAPSLLTAPASSTSTVLNIVDSPMRSVPPASDEPPSSATSSLDTAIGTATNTEELDMDENLPVAAAPWALTTPASSTSTVPNVLDSPTPLVAPVCAEPPSSASRSLDAVIVTATNVEELSIDKDPVAAAPWALTTPASSTSTVPNVLDSPTPLASAVSDDPPSSTTASLDTLIDTATNVEELSMYEDVPVAAAAWALTALASSPSALPSAFDWPPPLLVPVCDEPPSSASRSLDAGTVTAANVEALLDALLADMDENLPVVAAPWALTTPASSTSTVPNVLDSPTPLASAVSDDPPSSATASLDIFIDTAANVEELSINEDVPVAAAAWALTALASSSSAVPSAFDWPPPLLVPVCNEPPSSASRSLDAVIVTATNVEELNMDEDMPVAAGPLALSAPAPSTLIDSEYFDTPMPLAAPVCDEPPSSATSSLDAAIGTAMNTEELDMDEDLPVAAVPSALPVAAVPSALTAPAPSTHIAPEPFDVPMPLVSTISNEAFSSTTTTPAELVAEMDLDDWHVENTARPPVTAVPWPLPAPAFLISTVLNIVDSPMPLASTVGGEAAPSTSTTPAELPAISAPLALASPTPSAEPPTPSFVTSTPPATPNPAPAPSSYEGPVPAISAPAEQNDPAASLAWAPPRAVAAEKKLKQAPAPAAAASSSSPVQPASALPLSLAMPGVTTKATAPEPVLSSSTPVASANKPTRRRKLYKPARPTTSLPPDLSSMAKEDPSSTAISPTEASNNSTASASTRNIIALPSRTHLPAKFSLDIATTPLPPLPPLPSLPLPSTNSKAGPDTTTVNSSPVPPTPTPSTRKKSSMALEYIASLNGSADSATTSNGGSSGNGRCSSASTLADLPVPPAASSVDVATTPLPPLPSLPFPSANSKAGPDTTTVNSSPVPPTPTPSTRKKSSMALEYIASVSRSDATTNRASSDSGSYSSAFAEMQASASAALNRGDRATQQAPQARVGNFAAQRLGRTGTSALSPNSAWRHELLRRKF
ncbi:hypothetical protein JCM5296_001051 [Sporobolomyces johnsonii]